MAETAAARAERDHGTAEAQRVYNEFSKQAAERLARLYVDPAGANAAFDTIVSDAVAVVEA